MLKLLAYEFPSSPMLMAATLAGCRFHSVLFWMPQNCDFTPARMLQHSVDYAKVTESLLAGPWQSRLARADLGPSLRWWGNCG